MLVKGQRPLSEKRLNSSITERRISLVKLGEASVMKGTCQSTPLYESATKISTGRVCPSLDE